MPANPTQWKRNPATYVPGELLAREDQMHEVQRLLTDCGIAHHTDHPDPVGLVRVWWDDQATDAGDVVDAMRAKATEQGLARPGASPNHIIGPVVDRDTGEVIVFGASDEAGGPARPPEVADTPLKARTSRDVAGTGVTIGVADTGYVAHPWSEGAVLSAPGNFDPLDENHDQRLDREAGHGTFATGAILQQAPGATVRVVRVLNQFGRAKISDVANQMLRLADLGADVISLSLGGYTSNDNEPLAIRSALDVIKEAHPDTVVVAAAGNHNPSRVRRSARPLDRPFYPAACHDVIGVGALNPIVKGEDPERAPFSNFGAWVDVSTVGVDVLSTFVTFADKDKDFQGWATWSGTSFAAPTVAGAIAGLMTNKSGHRVRTARQAAEELLSRRVGRPLEAIAAEKPPAPAVVGPYLPLPSPFVP